MPTLRPPRAPKLPALTSPVTFVIPGPPRTKKNHGRRIMRGKRIFNVPSEAYTEWNKLAVWSLRRNNLDVIDCPVNCRALFFREALVGDAVGYYQALADTLENAGVLTNDKLIVSWDGSRILKDALNPRIIVTLEPAA